MNTVGLTLREDIYDAEFQRERQTGEHQLIAYTEKYEFEVSI